MLFRLSALLLLLALAPTALAQHERPFPTPVLPAPGAEARASAYVCPETCVAPDCVCASTETPGDFPTEDAPQFVLLTFDDCLAATQLGLIEDLEAGLTNPDGRPVPLTHFVNVTNCWGTGGAPTSASIVQQRYQRGDEIANHTETHTTSSGTTLGQWLVELAATEQFLESAGVPRAHVNGFRAPYVATNEAMWNALQARGYRYDSSLMEQPLWSTSPSTGQDNYVWPHTLDHGAALDCETFFPGNNCPQTPRPGLWEIPLYYYTHPLGEGAPSDSMYYGAFDPGASLSFGPLIEGQELLDLLHWNANERYTGNRVPVTLYMHATDLQDAARRGTLNQFMHELRQKDDVWFITMRGLIEWMEAPVPASQMTTWYAEYCERYPCAQPVSSEPVAGSESGSLRASVFPNPTHGSATLELTLDASVEAHVAWFDLLGRRVAAETIALPAGTHRLDAPALPTAGTYIVRVRVGTETVTQRVTRL